MSQRRKHLRLLACAAFTMLLAASAVATEPHSLDELTAATHQFLQEHYTLEDDSAATEVSVTPLDPRLRLAQCPMPLTFTVRDLGDKGGAVSVKAQCEGQQPWSIYVSAQVDIHRDVLVAAVTLGRGALIDESVIRYQRFNTSDLRQGYMVATRQVLGQQLKRPLQAGEPLRSGVLEQPLAVERGDIVTLESSNGSITVATQAEALSSGRIGEQIRVRNTSSERVISANVLAKGRVGANF